MRTILDGRWRRASSASAFSPSRAPFPVRVPSPARASSPFRVPFPALLLALALLLGAGPLAAEVLWSASGFFVDLPAGFAYKDGDGASRFSFADPKDGMEFAIRVYEPGRFPDSESLAADVAGRLRSEGERETFNYEGRKAVLAELAFSLGSQQRKGYGFFVAGRGPKEKAYAVLAHAAARDFEAYADFVLSCVDGFAIDKAALRDPGPMSQYVLAWPPERSGSRRIALPGGASAELPWSPDEAREEIDVATREYKVLASYEGSAEFWVEAWTRFYRMIYRQSAARMDLLALEMSRILPVSDPTETARRLLAWVQGFVYERDQKGIDFVTPLVAAFEGRGDCDSRAVVMAIILERLGVDCVLMLSREYSHAMIGVDVPGGGQRFPWKGKRYLVGETTAKVGLGMIAANQSDWKKWIGVDLGE